MCADLAPLRAEGERVVVATVQQADLPAHARAVERSRARLRVWNPVNPHELSWHMRNQTPQHRTFIIHARQPEGDHGIVGRVNVTNILRGRAHGASLGYDAYDPYAGRGLFAEGLALVVGLLFQREPDGLGLHRVEAHVQPGNVRSAGMLRSLGFRRRGAWPAYLTLPDASGVESWRDHVVYGVLAEEWPAGPYPRPERAVPLAFIDGPGPDCAQVGAEVAEDLGAVVLDARGMRSHGGVGLLASLVAAARGGAVVTGPTTADEQAEMIAAAGLDPARVTLASVTGPMARERIVQLVLEIQARAGGYLV